MAFDRRGYVAYMNRSAEKLLGFDASARKHCSSVFAPGGDVESFIKKPYGQKPVERELTLLPNSQSRVNARISRVSCRDVSALVFLTPLERRPSDQHKRIDRLASLGELAAGVAHEIRNPLAGIGTSAQVLRSRLAGDDERVKFADVILDEVGRLEKIIENLLMFARPKQPQLVKHDLRESVERALNLVSEQVEKQGVKVQRTYSERLPSVYVDPGQMSQVLLNLVLNAIQAMPLGGKLTVELGPARKKVTLTGGRRKTDQKGAAGTRYADFVRLAVSDTGAGISKEHLAKLFTPFFTTKSNGTGLGLSISRAILREHGGGISISSVQGEGTKVFVDIPVEKRHGERR